MVRICACPSCSGTSFVWVVTHRSSVQIGHTDHLYKSDLYSSTLPYCARQGGTARHLADSHRGTSTRLHNAAERGFARGGGGSGSRGAEHSHCHAQAPRLKKLHKAGSGEGVQLKEYNGGLEVFADYHDSALLCQYSALIAFHTNCLWYAETVH